MEKLQLLLLEEFSDEAERSFTLGDAFDMKANVLLVVITFLAAQTAYFLKIAGLPLLEYGQIISAILLAICGVLVLIELFPRTYLFFEPSNGAIERKIRALKEEGNGDGILLQKLIDAKIGWARERATENGRINSLKSKLLGAAFWFLCPTVAINLLTLAWFAMCPSSRVY